MNKGLLVGLILLLAVPCFAANGDILAVSIDESGYTASITIEGLGTGGTYDMGFGTNNNPSTAKIVFTVVSMGYDDTGSPTTLTRTVYGTIPLRKPYPDYTTNQETVSGSDVIVKVVLSEHIYAKDNTGAGKSGTAPTVSIASGFYTQSETPNNAVSDMTVTNNSTAVYQPVVGNWTWPGWERITGNTLTLRAVAFHMSAQQGRPVRAVKFTCVDQSANSTSTTLTQMTADPNFGDASVVTEYVAQMDMTDLTQGHQITCNFIAYPWYGDDDSLLNTGDGVYSQPTPYYAPQYYLLDKTGGVGFGVCVVDSDSGNDSTGACVAESAFNPASPPNAFATINKAAQALQAFNNAQYSRNVVEGTIYLNAGSHLWTGATNTINTATATRTWVTIKPFPGLTKSNVTLLGHNGNRHLGASTKVKIEDVTIYIPNTISTPTFTDYTIGWFHNCSVSSDETGQTSIYAISIWDITQSSIGVWPMAFYGFGTGSKNRIARGNLLNGHNGNISPYVFIGNKRTDVGWSSMQITEARTAPLNNIGPIIAYNQLYGAATNPVKFYSSSTLDYENRGFAMIQNVLEYTKGGGTDMMVAIAYDGSVQTPVNNIMLWHNTIIGARGNLAYNDAGDQPAERKYWSAYNNVIMSLPCKSDTFGTAANGARIGNWPFLMGVDQVCNTDANTMNFSIKGQFKREFEGLYTTVPLDKHGSPPSSTPNSIFWEKYFDHQANDGTNDGAGNGLYMLNADSPVRNLSPRTVIPFDIEGKRRRLEWDDAGAYTRGLPKVF